MRAGSPTDSSDFDASGSHKLMTLPLLGCRMVPAAFFAALAQAGLVGSQLGQLLVGLVLILLVILVGRVVLRIAWRIVTIGVVLVGALVVLTAVGVL